ncbi:tax1-binding protein 1 homolog A [Stigmatopora nigra]
MSSFQVVDSSPGSSVMSIMETSNFAHVIFQNVGKSFLPQAPLECRYTLTPYITPHFKDWVGIFKVGWSTARDYYTFMWSPMPEKYEPGSTVNRSVVFQGYYVPKSDGEFYQFCYVTHGGDIRGASTPFQFRSATPTEEELLTVSEEDSNSDILVVTNKSGLLERVEETHQELKELRKSMRLLQEENQQLQDEQKRLSREREQERETCCLLRTHNQELLRSSQSLSEEREEARRRLTEASDRVRQLEEDLLGVTQRGLQKETELDCLRDRFNKLTGERDHLEIQLKNEKDDRDLYKVHLRGTELENTKLSAELQMLKAVELNREVTIAQFQEELERLRICAAQRDNLEKELLILKDDKAELAHVRERLRQAEEQLAASRQQASLLASELRDSTGAREHSVTELYRARLEVDKLRASLSDAQAECQNMEEQLDRMRSATRKGEAATNTLVVSEAEAELQREVEELKLRLHMAAEHYKEKYRECQRLRRQVAKLNAGESHAEHKRNASTETVPEPLTPTPDSPTAGIIALQEASTLTISTELENPSTTADIAGVKRDDDKSAPEGERDERREDSLRMTSWVEVPSKWAGAGEEKDAAREEEGVRQEEDEDEDEEEETAPQSPSVEEELALMEEKWKEQCAINETLQQRLANEEERFRVQMAERTNEVMELKQDLARALEDKERLQEELHYFLSREQDVRDEEADVGRALVMRYPLPYPQDPSPPPLVPRRPAELQFGNPYADHDTQDQETDISLSPEQLIRPPPEAPPCATPCAPPITPTDPISNPGAGWAQEVVRIQPSRSTSPPKTAEEPPKEAHDRGDGAQASCDHPPGKRDEARAAFCFESSNHVHKRCPLCEVIFPPHFEQRSFEQHVESHWKVCPVCAEQFPLECHQRVFERHVLTHFDGHVLNFDQIE